MKKHIYFVSLSYTDHAGVQGFARGQQVFDEPITTLEQIKEIENNLLKDEPRVMSATVVSYILLRIETMESNTINRIELN